MTLSLDSELMDMAVVFDTLVEESDAVFLDMEHIVDMAEIQDLDVPVLDMDTTVECGLNIDLVGYKELSFHYQQSATIMGDVVTDQSMSPVEGATVLLYDSFQTAVFETVTDIDGRFVLDTNVLYQFSGLKVGSIGLRLNGQQCSDR